MNTGAGNSDKISALAELVHRYASNLASQNNADTGQVLLQAVWHFMVAEKQKTESKNSNEGLGTSNLTRFDVDKILYSSLENVQGTSADFNKIEISKGLNQTVKQVSKCGNNITQNPMDCTVEVIVGHKTLSENEKMQDYFDMDCEEINEMNGQSTEKENERTDTDAKGSKDEPEVFIIEDDDGEVDNDDVDKQGTTTEHLKNTSGVDSAIAVGSGNNEESGEGSADHKNRKNFSNEATPVNEVVNTSDEPDSIDIIDLDSDCQEEMEDSNSSNVNDMTNSNNDRTEKIDKEPVSVVGFFTNKAVYRRFDNTNTNSNNDVVSNTEGSILSPTRKNQNHYKSNTQYTDNQYEVDKARGTNEFHGLNALGLVHVSANKEDTTPQKRSYSEMVTDNHMFNCGPDIYNNMEGSTSPRMKKRLLDFDKKWHLAPKIKPEEDKYLTRPGGIDANIYRGDSSKHLMPSVNHLEGVEFRKPGYYTSFSSCSPNVIIESVDSNEPYPCSKTISNTHFNIDQEYRNIKEEEDSDSGYTDISSRSNQSSRSYKGSSHKQPSKNNQKLIPERSKNSGQSRGLSVKHRHGKQVVSGRGSRRGRGRGIGRPVVRGRGSSRGRGRGVSPCTKETLSVSLPKSARPLRGSIRSRGSRLLSVKSFRGSGRGVGQSLSSSRSRGSMRGRGLGRGSVRGPRASRGSIRGSGVGRGSKRGRGFGRGSVRGRGFGRGSSARGRGLGKSIEKGVSSKIHTDSESEQDEELESVDKKKRGRKSTSQGVKLGDLLKLETNKGNKKNIALRSQQKTTNAKVVSKRLAVTALKSSLQGKTKSKDLGLAVSAYLKTAKVKSPNMSTKSKGKRGRPKKSVNPSPGSSSKETVNVAAIGKPLEESADSVHQNELCEADVIVLD